MKCCLYKFKVSTVAVIPIKKLREDVNKVVDTLSGLCVMMKMLFHDNMVIRKSAFGPLFHQEMSFNDIY